MFDQLAATLAVAAFAGTASAVVPVFADLLGHAPSLARATGEAVAALERIDNSLHARSRSNLPSSDARASSFTFIHAAVVETLRLRPPVHCVVAVARARLALSPDGGDVVERGTVLKAIFADAMRDDPAFGDRPADYNPERFLAPGGHKRVALASLGFANLSPDGASGRRCPGRDPALAILVGLVRAWLARPERYELAGAVEYIVPPCNVQDVKSPTRLRLRQVLETRGAPPPPAVAAVAAAAGVTVTDDGQIIAEVCEAGYHLHGDACDAAHVAAAWALEQLGVPFITHDTCQSAAARAEAEQLHASGLLPVLRRAPESGPGTGAQARSRPGCARSSHT